MAPMAALALRFFEPFFALFQATR